MKTRTVTVELPEEWARNLEALTGGTYGPADLAGVLIELADHAQQGVYRPGSWERPWLIQAFGYDFEDRLEPDTDRLVGGRAVYARPR